MRIRRLPLFALAVIVGLVALAPPAAGAIRIGLLLPLSGPLSAAGDAARHAAQLATETESGIELRIADTAGTSEGARNAARRLIDAEQVHAMAGAIASPAAWAAAEVAESNGVSLVIFGASATAVTEPPWRHVFRINPPLEEKFAALAAFLARHTLTEPSAAVLCEDRPPAMAISESWLSATATVGLDPMYRIPLPPGLVDYRPELAKVRLKQPDLMILIASPEDGALMMRQSRELNLSPSLVLGESAGFARPGFAEKSGGAGEFVCALVPWAPSVSYPGARRFADAYRNRYDRLPGHHEALAYAALAVVADAARRARAQNRSALRDALAETDLSTICGRVRFDPHGARPGQNRSSWLLVQWQQGRLETIWPPKRASADPVFPFPPWRSRLPVQEAVDPTPGSRVP